MISFWLPPSSLTILLQQRGGVLAFFPLPRDEAVPDRVQHLGTHVANGEWRQLAWSPTQVCEWWLHLLQVRVLVLAGVRVEARAVQAVGLPAVLRAADPKQTAELLSLLLGLIHLGNCAQEIRMSEHRELRAILNIYLLRPAMQIIDCLLNR